MIFSNDNQRKKSKIFQSIVCEAKAETVKPI